MPLACREALLRVVFGVSRERGKSPRSLQSQTHRLDMALDWAAYVFRKINVGFRTFDSKHGCWLLCVRYIYFTLVADAFWRSESGNLSAL